MKTECLKLRPKNDIGTKTGGALFLALSSAALLTLGVLGYLKFSDMDKMDVSAPTSAVEVTGALASPTVMQEKIRAKLPAARDEMVVPLRAALQGKWMALFGHGGVVHLNISDDTFEVIYMQTPQSAMRKYSRGFYEYDERMGKITLSPSRAAVMPAPVAGVYYKILTMRPYDIFISKLQDDVSLYFIAPESEIITKNYYPLFSYADFDGAPVLQFSPMQVQK